MSMLSENVNNTQDEIYGKIRAAISAAYWEGWNDGRNALVNSQKKIREITESAQKEDIDD